MRPVLAAQRLAAQCRPRPRNAVPGELALPSSMLLNRLAFAFFGVPLILLGGLIWSLGAVAGDVAAPLMLIAGAIGACAIGGMVAKRTLPEVDRALKASGAVPSIKRRRGASTKGLSA